MPRAQTEAMPMMNATNSSAETTAAPRVSRPRTRQAPTTTSSDRQQVADRWWRIVAGQQLVGADREHALRRVRAA